MLRTNQLSGTDEIWFERIDNGAATSLLTVNQELAAGDILLLRVKGSTIEAWRHLTARSWSRLGVVHGLDLRNCRLRRRRAARHDRSARRLRGADVRCAAARHRAAEPPRASSASATARAQIDLAGAADFEQRRRSIPVRSSASSAARRAATRTSPRSRRLARRPSRTRASRNGTTYYYTRQAP